MDAKLTNEIDSALVIVPLRALLGSDETRYVDWEAVHQVVRSYRKYMNLNAVEHAIVDRMSRDLYDLFESGSRRLIDLVASAQAS